MLLGAFNHELARAREVAREPGLALIRLHWWREVVEGAARRHELAAPLTAALAAGTLPRADLAALIDARETEAAAAIETLADWQDYLRGTAGALAAIAASLLGATDSERARIATLGTAYGVAGQVRSIAVLARQGRCLLPLDLLTAQGLSAAEVVARPAAPALRPVLATLAAWGRALLAEGRGPLPRAVIAAALPAVLARRDLRQLAPSAGPRGFADRAAVLAAYLAGRV